jgi:hypothetical protein
MDPGDRADLGTSPREGMSLRDWFAGMALQGVLAAHADPETVLPKQTDAAEMAYQYADAMLAQQRKVVSSP